MGPKGVSVDQNGHVIVVDNKACMVFIFQPSGKLVTKFGSRGNGDKQFAGNKTHSVYVVCLVPQEGFTMELLRGLKLHPGFY